MLLILRELKEIDKLHNFRGKQKLIQLVLAAKLGENPGEILGPSFFAVSNNLLESAKSDTMKIRLHEIFEKTDFHWTIFSRIEM